MLLQIHSRRGATPALKEEDRDGDGGGAQAGGDDEERWCAGRKKSNTLMIKLTHDRKLIHRHTQHNLNIN
jgi:hypothetical protein